MFQDQQFLNELHELPPDRQAEVLDFIRALKRKQQAKAQSSSPRFGSAKGLIEMADDFDEPLEVFQESAEQRQERLSQADDLFQAWQDDPLPEEEQIIWEMIDVEGIPPVAFQEPSLEQDHQV